MSLIAEVRHQSCLVWNKLKEKHLKPFEAVSVDVTLRPAIQTHYKSIYIYIFYQLFWTI